MSKSTELVPRISPTAEPTPTPGVDGSGGRDLAKDNGTPPSSTSLYLYVFFAVLIIVVFSSATLMTRSLVNRRRQRRLFEDSILRETWYPIDHGGDLMANTPYGGNFDLKPPKMWEAFIRRERRTVGSTAPRRMVAEWGSIRPLSVTTVKRLSPSKTRPATSNAEITHRICRYLGTTDVPPPLESNIGSSNTNDTNPKMGGVGRVYPIPEPQKVIVATLIVMPSRSRSSRALSAFPPPPTTFSSGSSLTSATPLLTDPALPSSSFPQHTNVTEPLTHLEFGIMELVMR